jgi:hypothetical protein
MLQQVADARRVFGLVHGPAPKCNDCHVFVGPVLQFDRPHLILTFLKIQKVLKSFIFWAFAH